MPARLFFLVALLVLAGCDSGGPTVPSDCDNGLSGFFIAQIDGRPFEANCYAATFTDGVFVIAGSEVSGDQVMRRIELIVNGRTEGTYPIGGGAEATLTVTGPDRTFEAASGQVLITQPFPESPAGRFDFTGQSGGETVSVTDGSFDVFQ